MKSITDLLMLKDNFQKNDSLKYQKKAKKKVQFSKNVLSLS